MRHQASLSFLIVWTCTCVTFVAQPRTAASGDLFAQFPAGPLFRGKPHPPILTDPDAHLFRTRIREGVAKGVTFAGHYEVAEWGCGAGCLSFAIIDAVDGRVHFFPATISQDREVGERLMYKRDSRAVHVIGSLNEENSASRWYVWNGSEFELISEGPAVLVDDHGDPIGL